MASALNSAPTANASGNANSGSHSGRSTLRPSNSTKGSDNRRQSGSPVDGGARRSNSHKAWTQGTNPITQRSSHSTSNGNMAHRGQSGSPRPNQKESNTPDSHAHDRLVFLFASFIGLQTTITTKAGEKFSGIFSNSTLESNDSSFTLKMVQRADQEDQLRTNGVSDVATPYLGTGPDHNLQFDIREIVDISVPNVTTAEVSAKEPNGASQGFRTDSDISGNLAMRERTLQRWEPAENDVNLSIETSNSTAGWDQFEANERLFGTRTNYDENVYTTRLDRSTPTYTAELERASRIAAEIEGTASDNSHMREERGLVAPATGDQDEEDKYSGVRREEKAFPPLLSGQPNKYTPPGRRQVAPQPPTLPNVPPKQAAATTSAAPVIKEDASTDQQPEPTTMQPSAEIEGGSASAKALSPAPPAAKRPSAENATANVEAEVLDHFRQFANSEKLKMQERRRNQASYDRTVKLNELMKFSKSFKLSTPVPKDLVPILAKDRMKQEEIIQRAHQAQQQGGDDKGMPKTTSPPTEPKPPARGTGPTGAVPPVAPADRQNYQRSRQGYPPTGPLAGPNGRFPQQPIQPGRPGVGMLGHRLADNLQQRKGAGMAPVPAPLPIQDARGPPTGPASDQHKITSPVKSQGPGSSASSKFNVRAMEFKPNPAASTFTPGGAPSTATASPRPFSRSRSVSRTTTPTAFFGPRKPKPISERPSLNDQFNPIKRMKKESSAHAEKPYSFNDGIPPPYKTLPTWDSMEGNEEKTYDQMFKQPIVTASSQGRSVSNNPQQHQMPFHFQQGNPGLPASGGPNGGHLHPQGHHGPPHVDDHRMHMSGSNSGVFPSPRMQPGYPSPMAPPAQVAFGQPMPPFYGNPQGGQMRPYQGGPQFVNPQAPMMVQQPSNGPFMGVPQGMGPYNQQMPMYSPSPAHAYPQHAPAPQPHSGYPSPSRGAPMMMHQNSQSGQPPQPMMYMPGHHMPPNRGNYPQQPHFSSSPHQSHHFHPNQHRTPSNGFNQMPQMPPQMSTNTPNSGASHSAEATDEGK